MKRFITKFDIYERALPCGPARLIASIDEVMALGGGAFLETCDAEELR